MRRPTGGYAAAVAALSVLLALQLIGITGSRRAAAPEARHRVSKAWAFLAGSLGDARNLATDVVLGVVAGVASTEMVVRIPGEPDGEDRIAMDVVTIAVERVYKGSAAQTLLLNYTRGVADVGTDPDDLVTIGRVVPQQVRTAADTSAGPAGALTDDPPYLPGEWYVLFLRPGRRLAVPQVAVTAAPPPSKVVLAPEGRYRVTPSGLEPVSDRGFAPSMRGKSLSQFESQLAALDGDGDGVLDTADNCPATPNPQQTLPPWTVPPDDPDCDGFATRVDNFTVRGPLVACPRTATALDEPRDAWPADLNDDQAVNTLDEAMLGPSLGTRAGSESGVGSEQYVARHDLNADLFINATDLTLLRSFLGRSCATTGR